MSWEKFQKKYGNCLFPKSEPVNQKIRKFRDKSQMDRNNQEKFFENLGIPHEVVLFFGIYVHVNSQFLYSALALASSFGSDHSELGISCKDDVHSTKETL